MCSTVDTHTDILTRRISLMQQNDAIKHARRSHKEEYRKVRNDGQNLPAERPSSSSSPGNPGLVLTVLETHRRDIFRTAPIDLNSRSVEAIDEHLTILHTEELVLQISGGHQHPVLTSMFPAAMQDPVLFTCFLAATQSFYEHRRSSGRFKPSDYLLSLQAKGLAGVRDRIMQAGNGQDTNLIAGIIELMVTDSIVGNTASLISHQRGARKLIALRKNTDDESLLFKTMLGVLVVIEFYVALVQFLSHEPTSPPAGENPLKYLKHPFPSSVCVSISVLPQGLEDLVLTGNLSLQTISLLQKVNSWSTAMQEISSGSDKAQTAFHQLFAEPMECSRSAIFILRHLRKSNRQLTIEWILLVGIVIIIKHQGSTNITDPLDEALVVQFSQTIVQFAHPTPIESDTITWLATAVALRKHAAYPVYSDQIIDQLIDLRESSEELHPVQTIWSKYLWNDRFGGPWTRLWQSGLDRLRSRRDANKTSALSHRGVTLKTLNHCAFSQGFATIKKEDSVESIQSMPATLSLTRSWTLSDDGTRSQPTEHA